MGRVNFYEGAERRQKLTDYIKQLKDQGEKKQAILEKAWSFNDDSNYPPIADSEVLVIVKSIVTPIEDTKKRIVCYEGNERIHQVIKHIVAFKKQEPDRNKILESARNFNRQNNNPQLSEVDLQLYVDLYGETRIIPQHERGVLKQREVTLSNGRKVTLRGGDIIDVN